MPKKMINRTDIAREVAQRTGFYIKDVEQILAERDTVIIDALQSGVTKIKEHKLYQIEVETKPAKKNAWNGLDKVYFSIPEKKIIKFKPLVAVEEVIDSLNKKET
ncbi:putative DNA-binding protein [Listeria phage LMTA-94]|uniref:Integration host factor n=5 Tax=Pecentumvirus TaxID=1857844 RepID=A0A068CA08_9CAUD|nr:DNA binding protein [Listeria phage vB_LmoM_AG20]YP_009043144.1 DNA binding protein [Listeria phage LMSP-25]YP_009616262.1 DNA binding protein [Listeria phage LMTA-34]YP_009793383.1 putative DNA-binding protein [Listeria phage LMTA-57]YP_009793549.1 putative DNA-binding protein [Listeria phage LMTA-94]WIW77365.1 DNA-binding protein [Listeria phage cka15]AFJ76064.1 putative DNA-binding protein [Listeria phage vB_LmoM_AG20]AIA64502.1 putative DNA-binding protein [Listeria phage LMSP-25]AID